MEQNNEKKYFVNDEQKIVSSYVNQNVQSDAQDFKIFDELVERQRQIQRRMVYQTIRETEEIISALNEEINF